MTAACMGGWCTRREKCPHFHATGDANPAERLCLPGNDGAILIDMKEQKTVQVQIVNRRPVNRLVAAFPPLKGPLGTGEPL